jgi:hypothetical protein
MAELTPVTSIQRLLKRGVDVNIQKARATGFGNACILLCQKVLQIHGHQKGTSIASETPSGGLLVQKIMSQASATNVTLHSAECSAQKPPTAFKFQRF